MLDVCTIIKKKGNESRNIKKTKSNRVSKGY